MYAFHKDIKFKLFCACVYHPQDSDNGLLDCVLSNSFRISSTLITTHMRKLKIKILKKYLGA